MLMLTLSPSEPLLSTICIPSSASFSRSFWTPSETFPGALMRKSRCTTDEDPEADSRCATAETGDGGGVDFLVELCATVVLDAVFDGGDDQNKEERKGSGGGRGGAKDGKEWEASGGECVDREGLPLEHNEGEKVNVGCSTRDVNWCGHWSMGGLTGGIAQRGSWVGM